MSGKSPGLIWTPGGRLHVDACIPRDSKRKPSLQIPASVHGNRDDFSLPGFGVEVTSWMRPSDQPFASISRPISGSVTDFIPTVRVGFPFLFPQNFQYAGYGLADVVLDFIHGFSLRIAAREGWNLCPKPAFRVFVDDHSVVLDALILSR